jgi:putative peptidoglycan lipid II flippase
MKTRMWRIILASVAMGAALYGLNLVLAEWLVVSGKRYLALLALILGGTVVYFAVGQVIGAFSLGELRAALRRSRATNPGA